MKAPKQSVRARRLRITTFDLAGNIKTFGADGHIGWNIQKRTIAILLSFTFQ